jgi:hypothetical protein
MNSYTWASGNLINQAQTTFIGLLRVLSIPIVVLLSVASGFTTYHGMSYFITPWIALIITIAVQSIMVICSLEIASIHWRANPLRYLLVSITLVVSVAVSASFSYFKFYEISEKQTIELQRLASMKQSIDEYLKTMLGAKAELIREQQAIADQAGEEANLAFLGTHPAMGEKHRGKVGPGPYWEQYRNIHEEEVAKIDVLADKFESLAERIAAFRIQLLKLGERSEVTGEEYRTVVEQYSSVQSVFEKIMSDSGRPFPAAPLLLPYAEFTQGFKPSFAMWRSFSWFAFTCAVIVDLFTIILSYRLEFTAPGPLTDAEQELAFLCLREFRELRINHNDELELHIEKTELERARKYSDWNRSFGAAYLLNRGYLRKVDAHTVEFAPNLYPIIASRLVKDRADATPASAVPPAEEPSSSLTDTVKRLYHERKR